MYASAVESRKTALRAQIKKLTEEIDNQFWLFTRCARGQPVSPVLTQRRGALEMELRELSAQKFQPRYVAYAKTNDREPDEQLEHDRVAFPGGCMAGYIVWINGRWAAWDEKNGYKRGHIRLVNEHEAFTDWLFADSERTKDT